MLLNLIRVFAGHSAVVAITTTDLVSKSVAIEFGHGHRGLQNSAASLLLAFGPSLQIILQLDVPALGLTQRDILSA
ncbi:hypothetical protein LguiB_013530 [Lonicera macranthoides]